MKNSLIVIIKVYQKVVSPLLGQRCRFYPSCSHYLQLSLAKDSFLVALRKGILRIAKCHPLHHGGIDYP